MTSLWRRLARIGLIGMLLALAVSAGGCLLERTVIGGDVAQARARVEREVRAAFDEMARGLERTAGSLERPDLIRAAQSDDTAAERALFSAAAAAIADQGDVALTVYRPDGTPLAWAGRASELAEREDPPGGKAWILGQGPLGLRLVYLRSVVDSATRLGTVVAERPVPLAASTAGRAGLRDTGVDRFRFPTRIAHVSLQLPREGPPQRLAGATFEVAAPSGEPLLLASLADADVDNTRLKWRRATHTLSFFVLAVAVALLAGPLLDWRSRARRTRDYVAALLLIGTCIAAARALFRFAGPADWSTWSIFSAADYRSALPRLPLGSPFDFLLTILAAAALIALALFAVEAWRVGRPRRRDPATTQQRVVHGLVQLAAGTLLTVIVIAHRALLADTVTQATMDLLQFGIRPWSAARLALQTGLIIADGTAIGAGVLVLRAATARWHTRRAAWQDRAVAFVGWVAPSAVWLLVGMPSDRRWPLAAGIALIVALAVAAPRLVRRYRHGSQAFRLALLALGLVLPAATFYSAIFQLAWDAKIDLVQTLYAPYALNQRANVKTQLLESRNEIDRFPGLVDLLATGPPAGTPPSTDQAFQVWQSTSLALYSLTSSVELYGPNRALASRFAFNLPEDLAAPVSEEQTCTWDVYEGVLSFFAEQRRVLHAGRLVCDPNGSDPPLGSIVIRAILDYENLPFIYSRNPYVELMRPGDPLRNDRLAGRDVEYAVYGWSRTPLYQSGDRAWSIPDDVFARVERGREGLWARLERGEERFDVYLQNDRFGIYALGFPVATPLGHLVNLAEIVVLACATFLLLLIANSLFRLLSGRGTTAPALLREVRASFYRKLFIAFVAAVFLPVLVLGIVTRNYVADQMRASIEQEAVRMASAARRVVEDLVGPRAAAQDVGLDDNLMVWVSRLIDQDVNVFKGPRLLATSERNLFASGLLPTRTSADAYAALELRREAATVATERIGGSEHLVAATPLTTVRPFESTILSVPLTSRQREIDQEIDSLDRQVLLSVLLFMIAGSALGYVMAERISDPVNRLTRATRRIARGELNTRIAATSSDELRRLVEDFNGMARDLQRQRAELERTHRLEAWAEMARQVAHEIKNPLTPIQLNAEHLRRVHADSGRPLSPVLEECVETILTQVRLLRQIASEFSSFASAPTARRSPVDAAELLGEILVPYRTGLPDRIRFVTEVGDLPPVLVDRTLMARALSNVIENALHAMPGTGTLTVQARADEAFVRVRISDTGGGMDAEALARAFEPYFSTKATGTGLGLPIAKRNVELNGGTISVASSRGVGTSVELALPTTAPSAP